LAPGTTWAPASTRAPGRCSSREQLQTAGTWLPGGLCGSPGLVGAATCCASL
jgi:hypothetical protein